MDECPDMQTLNGILNARLSPEQEQQVSEHLDRCVSCRSRLQHAAAGDWTDHKVARNLKQASSMSAAERATVEKCASDPLILVTGIPMTGPPPRAVPNRDYGWSDETQHGEVMPAPSEGSYSHGHLLGGYILLEELGRGGMGTVYKAREAVTGRVVAIKVLHSNHDQTVYKRFLREARSAERCQHRNIVKVYGIHEKPVPYMVMEYINGKSLKTILTRRGALDLRSILQIGLQISEALAALHSQHVMHRDIKPSNLIIEQSTGLLKLTDFGLAHIAGDSRLTMDGYVTGTPAYMSPEQAQGDPIDHRSDLFSLGSVLYAMSTGVSPFDDDATVNVMNLVCTIDPDSAEKVNPNIPAALADLIRWLHSKQVEQRPRTAAEVSQILRLMLEKLDSRGGLERMNLGELRACLALSTPLPFPVSEPAMGPSDEFPRPAPGPVEPELEAPITWRDLVPWVMTGIAALAGLVWLALQSS